MAVKGNIHIANFSMFVSDIERRNIKDTVLRIGTCTFLNSKSEYLPNNFYKIIYKFKDEFTDFSDKVVIPVFVKEFNCPEKDMLKMPFNPRPVTVQGKRFMQFDKEFFDLFQDKVVTNINQKDYIECKENGDIDGGFKLSNDNYLVWY